MGLFHFDNGIDMVRSEIEACRTFKVFYKALGNIYSRVCFFKYSITSTISNVSTSCIV